MTQDLIVWVLLAGLVGISWLMVFVITAGDRRAGKGGHTHDSTDRKASAAPSRRGMAA